MDAAACKGGEHLSAPSQLRRVYDDYWRAFDTDLPTVTYDWRVSGIDTLEWKIHAAVKRSPEHPSETRSIGSINARVLIVHPKAMKFPCLPRITRHLIDAEINEWDLCWSSTSGNIHCLTQSMENLHTIIALGGEASQFLTGEKIQHLPLAYSKFSAQPYAQLTSLLKEVI